MGKVYGFTVECKFDKWSVPADIVADYTVSVMSFCASWNYKVPKGGKRGYWPSQTVEIRFRSEGHYAMNYPLEYANLTHGLYPSYLDVNTINELDCFDYHWSAARQYEISSKNLMPTEPEIIKLANKALERYTRWPMRDRDWDKVRLQDGDTIAAVLQLDDLTRVIAALDSYGAKWMERTEDGRFYQVKQGIEKPTLFEMAHKHQRASAHIQRRTSKFLSEKVHA